MATEDQFYHHAGKVWIAGTSAGAGSGGQSGDGVSIGGVLIPQRFAAISAALTPDNTLVAAVPAKKIRVLAYSIVASAAVNFKFQSAAAGTDLTGLKYMPSAGAGMVQAFNPLGWFETVAGELLNLHLSAAVPVGGELVYIEV